LLRLFDRKLESQFSRNPGASAGRRLHRQVPSKPTRPFQHSSQPQASTWLEAQVKPDPLVLDLYPERAINSPHSDHRSRDPCMTGDVGQRFLDNTIRGCLHFLLETSLESGVLKGYLNICLCGVFLEKPPESWNQPQIRQHRRPQIERHIVNPRYQL